MGDILDRLKTHSSAFDGLLALIPAEKYYETDNSGQWKKRKQSKEEHKRRKKAKLDPDHNQNTLSAADVMKKKVQDTEDLTEDSKELPTSTDQKTLVDTTSSKGHENKAVSKKSKKLRKANNIAKFELGQNTEHVSENNSLPRPTTDDSDERTSLSSKAADLPSNIEQKPSNLKDTRSLDEHSKSPAKSIQLSEASPGHKQELKSRLALKIEELRGKRKADGADGLPARNRQELMDARRKLESDRRERKKNKRLREKAAAQDSNKTGDSENKMQSRDEVSSKTKHDDKNLSFGRIAFNDGQQLDQSLQGFEKEKKAKNPMDILGRLKKIEAKKRRLENKPEEEREAIGVKDQWAKAINHATGEKVKDDAKLLKKALKRQENTKKKSSREWSERIDTMAKTKLAKVKKRETNLKARKEQSKKGGKKGSKPRSKNGGSKKSSGGSKKRN